MIIKSNISYKKENIYIIQYEGKEEEVKVSYGKIKGIDESNKYTFQPLCSTNKGSSGSPILNINNNKIIGIHKESDSKNYNRGTLLNYAKQEFVNEYNNNQYNNNQYNNIQYNNNKCNNNQYNNNELINE